MFDFIDQTAIRGNIINDYPIADLSWFRTGGKARIFYVPADVDDLSAFAEVLPSEVPITVLGLGSNVLIREGGISGVVIRLGRGFNRVDINDDVIRAGAIVPDVKLATAAAHAGFAGLEFYRGIPGSVGGALKMNAGAYGGQTADALIKAEAINRQGSLIKLTADQFNFGYRHSSIADDLILINATFRLLPGVGDEIIKKRMDDISKARKLTQPVNSRTGGSAFKNPDGHKSWQLIDDAGCRGLRVGGAKISELHCNFIINDGQATAYDIELLGEEVRGRVFDHSGIKLEWEIKRLGHFLPGREVEPFAGYG